MTSQPPQKLSLFALTATVVGALVGAGIFSLLRTFAAGTGPFGAIIAWCIAGGGMYMLARCFRLLPKRRRHHERECSEQKLPLWTLTAMVVGGMVGAGVFSIPRNFALATGVYGALIAWAVAGAGMLMLGFVFQTLANRKPDLDAGVYAYARAGFGPYVGFFSAFGYWASACVGNVSYWILIKSTLGAFFPVLGQGNTVIAVAISSVGIWAFYFLVLRGVKEAAAINKVVTIAKVIPLLLFVVLAIFFLKPDVFVANLWGGAAGDYGNLFEQVKATMLVTVFVFLGIEGASNYSRLRAKTRRRRHRDGDWFPRCACAVRVRVDPVLRHPAARRNSRNCASRRSVACLRPPSAIGAPFSSAPGLSFRYSAPTWPGP